jgi:hypothetical protein
MRYATAVLTACLLLGAPAAHAEQLAQAPVSALRIGAAAAVKGQVQLAALPGIRPVGKDAASGEPIYLGDQVTTGSTGRLQVLLLDETLFTIGPNATLVIDEFIYDPNAGTGKVAATVVKGAFRFITGKVARLNPTDMEVRLPVGSIGVRGTSVAGETDGTSATIVLLGPGPDSNTDERVGRIIVRGLGDDPDSAVEISRPGFATEIAGLNLPPTEPVRLDPARLAALTAPLTGTGPPAGNGTEPDNQPEGANGPPAASSDGSPPNGPSPDGSPPPGGGVNVNVGTISRESGSGLAGGLAGIGSIGALQPALATGSMLLTQATQAPPSLSADTTYEQLRDITQGTAVFAPQTVAMTGPGASGSYTISYSYDFGARSANGQITINTTSGFTMLGSGMFPLIANPFDTGTGPVVINENGINVQGVIGGTANVTYKFRNANNAAFSALDHSVTYNQGNTISGSGTSQRQ